MALLSLSNAYKSFGARKVLENASLSLDDGERVAIIGKNGAGKSTLLKILCEQMPLDSGTLAKRPNLVARILPQDPHFRADLSVREVCEASLQELVAIHKRVDEINALLQADSRELAQNTELLNELGTLTTQLDSIDGWDLEKRITELIENFHLKELQDRAIGTLSGGELKRLALATILMQPADLYILDEPTNHLDVEVVEFLESKLNALKACVLFISHDRYFIDNCARRIIEVDSSKLTNFRGGYGAYLSQKAAMLESLAKEHSRTLKLLKAEEEWLHKGVQARRKRNVLRKERVELLRAKAKHNPSLMRQIRLELERESKHHNRTHSHNAQKMIIECENLCVSMGGKPLIKDCSLRILQGDKIAIVGRNGAGKSSLLKVFLGEIAPQSGAIKRGRLKIGYFAQTRKELDDSKTLIETFCPNGGDHIEVRGKSMHIYGYLKSFLFPKDLLTQKIGALSGGEKTRVSLALLFTKQYDCLLLDEPTNDLDIATINILEEYLLSFSGALLLVSHDRYFIDKLAQKLLILHNPLQLDSSARGSRGESSVEESLQSFSQYLELSKEIAYYKQLESSLTNRDSALGSHSGDFVDFRATADRKSSSALKSTKSPTSNTASPRILEEANQASKSLRGDEVGVAIHTNAQKLDSNIEEMDCHDFDKSKSRNDDENAQIPNKLAKDSRINKNAQNVFSPNADRRQDLGDKNGALQGESRAHTRAYVTADSPQQSPFLVPKPTPKPFYGVGDNLQTTYTKAEQYAIIAEVERRCKQYLDPSFDPASFIYPRDNFALTAEVESLCVFRQSLDSSFSLSLAGAAEAVDSSVDCHTAATAAARNDDKKVDSSFSAHNATILKHSAKDSRILESKDSNVFSQNAPILNTPQAQLNLDSRKSPCDSKILDEKCGLQGKSQGSYLDGNDRRDFSPLPHLSSKAESPQAKKPLFTIAIPTYKRVALLRRAILSALAQDFDKPYEIIVVENPLEPIHYAAESMLQEFASRITYYQNAQNIGGLGNWNRCLELASGKWVCLLHSDDELLPSYLSTMHTLATNPAYSQALLIGAIEDASQIYPRTPLQRLYSKCITQARLQKLQMQASFSDGFCVLPPRAMLHNRAKCIEIGGYDESEAPSGDMTFFNRAALCGEVFCYRGDLLTRNHYEASSCKDPNVALMMILQNPQMFLGFSRKLTHAHLVGNYLWWSRYFAHLPLLRLYAQMRLRQQFRLFGVHPSWQERAKGYMREHCYAVFATLKAIKSLLTGRAGTQELESSAESERVDSAEKAPEDAQGNAAQSVGEAQTFMPPPH